MWQCRARCPLLFAGARLRVRPRRHAAKLAAEVRAADSRDADDAVGVASSVRQLFRQQGVPLPQVESAEGDLSAHLQDDDTTQSSSAAATEQVRQQDRSDVEQINSKSSAVNPRRMRSDLLLLSTGEAPRDLPPWATTRKQLRVLRINDLDTLLNELQTSDVDIPAALARLSALCSNEADKLKAKNAVLGADGGKCRTNVQRLVDQLAANRSPDDAVPGHRLNPVLVQEVLKSLISIGVPYDEPIIRELGFCIGKWAELGAVPLPAMIHICLKHSVMAARERDALGNDLFARGMHMIKNAISYKMRFPCYSSMRVMSAEYTRSECEDPAILLDVLAHCDLEPERLKQLQLRLSERLDQLQPVQLVRLIALLAARGDRNVPLLKAALSSYSSRFQSPESGQNDIPSTTQLYRLISALARLNFAPPQEMSLIGAQLAQSLDKSRLDLKWAFVNNILFTMGRLRWANEQLFDILLGWIGERMKEPDFGGAISMNYSMILNTFSRCNIKRDQLCNAIIEHVVQLLDAHEYTAPQRLEMLHSAVALDAHQLNDSCREKLVQMASDDGWCHSLLDTRVLPAALILANRLKLLNIYAILGNSKLASPDFLLNGDNSATRLGINGSEHLKESASRLKYGLAGQASFKRFLRAVDRLAPLGAESSVKCVTADGAFVDALLCCKEDGGFLPVQKWDSVAKEHKVTALLYWMYRHTVMDGNATGSIPRLTDHIYTRPMDTLPYEVVCASSTSPNYSADDITVDAPRNQSSRWTSDSTVPPQFVLLRLRDGPALVQAAKFGKYEKPHVCNVRKLVVYAGMCRDSLVEVCRGGLMNDGTAETLSLRYKTIDEDSVDMPVVYIKIMPTQSWGPAYNYALWHVTLLGLSDPARVSAALAAYRRKLDAVSASQCLKFCRAVGFDQAADVLENTYGVVEMHPRVKQLRDTILCPAYDLRVAERVLRQCALDQLLAVPRGASPYECKWHRIGTLVLGAPLGPEPRGGHQMVVDERNDKIYLLGGWNGRNDLSDFWCYDINRGTWRLVCADTAAVGGPPACSCHRMVLDTVGGQIFVLGRYVDPNLVADMQVSLISEMHAYEIETGQWHLVSDDTDADGGPQLIFDHQMVLDQANRTIYVSGGCIVASSGTRRRTSLTEHWACSVLGPSTGSMNSSSTTTSTQADKGLQYSGIYKYDIPSNTWRLLRRDAGDIGSASSSCQPANARRAASSSSGASLSAAERGGAFRGRSGHSMIFEPASRKIYIFAGARRRHELNDMLVYDVDNDELSELCNDENQPILSPAAGHTQRSTFDAEAGEIYVLSGMRHESESGSSSQSEMLIANSFWVFSVAKSAWTCVFESDHAATQRLDRERQQRLQHESRILSSPPSTQSSLTGSPANQHSLPRLLMEREQHILAGPSLGAPPLSHPNNVPLGSGAVAFPVGAAATRAAAQAAAAAAYAALVQDATQGMEAWRAHSETNSFDTRMQLLRAISRRGSRHAALHKARQQANEAQDKAPMPRFAHQFVFDAKRKLHFLFGGNPGYSPVSVASSSSSDTSRLDDFWQLSVKVNTWQDLLKRCIWLIRKTQFLCYTQRSERVQAVKYMQDELSSLALDIGYTDELHSLASCLFSAAPPPLPSGAEDSDPPHSTDDISFLGDCTLSPDGTDDGTLPMRRALFRKLVECFDRTCRPPRMDLRTIMACYL